MLRCYDELFEQVSFEKSTMEYVDSGYYGDVYRFGENGSRCLKIISKPEKIMNKELLQLIRDIDSLNLYRLFNFYYEDTNAKSRMVAYDMKYYESADIDMITMPTSYILDNFSDLLKLARTLADNRIETNDIDMANSIVTSDRIVLIDVDEYRLVTKWNTDIHAATRFYNTSDMRILMLSFIQKALYKYKVDWSFERDDLVKRCSELENLFLHNYEYSIDDIFKTLKKYKYPMDFIKRK